MSAKTCTKLPRPRRLTDAQRTGNAPILLADGRWYYAETDERGKLVTDPAVCEIWERGPDGRAVTWKSQAWLADALGITTRWVQKLEERGLPARGHRASCEYPVPHAIIWFLQYQIEAGASWRGSVKHLGIEEALARHDRDQAIAEAGIDFRIVTDPEFAAYMAAEGFGARPGATAPTLPVPPAPLPPLPHRRHRRMEIPA